MASYQRFFGEMIGTGALVFAASGAVIANVVSGGELGAIGIALAYGGAVLVMTASLSRVSGAQLNPAVTIARWAAKRQGTASAVMYLIAELIGAALGAWLLTRVFPDAANMAHLGAPALSGSVGRKMALLAEAVATAVVVWTYLAAMDKRNGAGAAHGGLTVGFAVVAAALVIGPLTGGALNPARAFGPAFITKEWINQWIYWIGPVVGALVATYAYRFTAGRSE